VWLFAFRTTASVLIYFDLHSGRVTAAKGYNSLEGMQLQMESVGGELAIQSRPGSGVQIQGAVRDNFNL
jgi:hypothetical protein